MRLHDHVILNALNSRFQIMRRFMHLRTVIFMSLSLRAVCKMSVNLKKYDSQCTQTSQNTECPVVTVFTTNLLNMN